MSFLQLLQNGGVEITREIQDLIGKFEDRWISKQFQEDFLERIENLVDSFVVGIQPPISLQKGPTKMRNHHFKKITRTLPVMLGAPKYGAHNTNDNRNNFLKNMSETREYKRIFDHKTGKLEIWFVMSNDNGRKITLWNTGGSCTIEIENFCLGRPLSQESHKFNPLGFSDSVNAYLLTEEDLAEQRRLITQEQERIFALKNAHESSPQTCGGVDRCEHCKSYARWHQQYHGYGT
jgi:hypothetical protein